MMAYINDDYLGDALELVYPTIDDFCDIVWSIRLGALMYKRLMQAYRKLSFNMNYYRLLGFSGTISPISTQLCLA